MRRLAFALVVLLAAPTRADVFAGRVHDGSGRGVEGAMLTLERGDPAHRVTVFTDASGGFRSPALPEGDVSVRVRRIGWRDLRITGVSASAAPLDLVLVRHTDPAEVAAQLPAHHWYDLALARVEDEALRTQLKRECTYCHQQGSAVTRRLRSEEEWSKLLDLMGRRGAMLPAELRAELPAIFNAAYDPATAVPALTQGWQRDDFAPPPPPEVRRAVIEEWDLGERASMQHDVVVHPDGRLYSVDGSQDRLYRLDPNAPGGARNWWPVPQGDLPPGGIFASSQRPQSQASNAHVGPHSLQVAPDGAVWLTLAIGNQLARFDPASERFETHEVADGYYPHTLRFDAKGRIWYTMAASNHVGMFDPANSEQRHVRLPARTLAQEVALRLMPVFLWIGRNVDLRGEASQRGDGFNMPVPYGIDIAPDGGVWFSQLNENRIGRIDPESLAVELVETPFPAPRRLRFDSKGILWVPSFSAGLLAAYDPVSKQFRSWPLPTEPLQGETPYALHVDRRTDQVWICGTNSDSMIRFEPEPERFTVYPLPTRVSYTRELDFDAAGRVWTSNSNSPAWQIEGGQPHVLRLDPDPERSAARLREDAERSAHTQ